MTAMENTVTTDMYTSKYRWNDRYCNASRPDFARMWSSLQQENELVFHPLRPWPLDLFNLKTWTHETDPGKLQNTNLMRKKAKIHEQKPCNETKPVFNIHSRHMSKETLHFRHGLNGTKCVPVPQRRETRRYLSTSLLHQQKYPSLTHITLRGFAVKKSALTCFPYSYSGAREIGQKNRKQFKRFLRQWHCTKISPYHYSEQKSLGRIATSSFQWHESWSYSDWPWKSQNMLKIRNDTSSLTELISWKDNEGLFIPMRLSPLCHCQRKLFCTSSENNLLEKRGSQALKQNAIPCPACELVCLVIPESPEIRSNWLGRRKTMMSIWKTEKHNVQQASQLNVWLTSVPFLRWQFELESWRKLLETDTATRPSKKLNNRSDHPKNPHRGKNSKRTRN